MNWINKRLSENASRVAIASAIGAWLGVWAKVVTPDQAIGATVAAVGAFAIPDKAPANG